MAGKGRTMGDATDHFARQIHQKLAGPAALSTDCISIALNREVMYAISFLETGILEH
jgi:hypothetical protein